jgi:hypothetical protein
MAYEDLREKGLVEDAKPNFALVSALLVRAMKDLETARVIASSDREWAYSIAHQGMHRAARAVITSEGLRTRGRDQSRSTVLLAGAILGEGARKLVNAFDRMRRRSQTIQEDPAHPVSRYEIDGALKDAQAFVDKTVEWARTKNPQLVLL